MPLRLRKPFPVPLLLCAAGIVTVLAVPCLCGGRGADSVPGSGSFPEIIALGTAGEEPLSPIGDDHWMDAALAKNVISQWLVDAPGSPTITVSRRDVLWVQSLTASAARQALAAHPRSAPNAGSRVKSAQ